MSRISLRRALRFLCALVTAASVTFGVSSTYVTPAFAYPGGGNSGATQASSFWLTNTQGVVYAFGSAPFLGDLNGTALNQPIVAMTPTNGNSGYWLVARDGGIFAYGNAQFYGSTGNIHLNQPIVSMTPTPDNGGYWMVASDGGIFAYGDAAFYGSMGGHPLNRPIVGMAATPSGHGYWLFASDGGIFSFGDAAFFGSTGGMTLQQPIVAMTSTPTSKGYWLVAADGGIFAYGDAAFYGSAGGTGDRSFNRIISTADGKGYWLVRNGGDSYAYGSATNISSGTAGANRPMFASMLSNITPGDTAVSWALTQLGKPYIWGGNGPDGYDCSGLTSQAWKRDGITIPRVANDQYNFGTRIPVTQVQTGDLLFWGTDMSDDRSIDHVGMYIGGGWGINAGGTGTGVNIRNIPQTSSWMWPNGVRP